MDRRRISSASCWSLKRSYVVLWSRLNRPGKSGLSSLLPVPLAVFREHHHHRKRLMGVVPLQLWLPWLKVWLAQRLAQARTTCFKARLLL